MEKSLGYYVRHPLALAAIVVSLVASLVQLPFVVDLGTWLVSSSGALFTASSVFAFTVLPEVDPAVAELAKPVAIVLGVVFALSKVYGAFKKLKSSVES
jgi:hypothetical protein